MKNKTPSYEVICAKANARKLTASPQPKRKYATETPLEIFYKEKARVKAMKSAKK